MAEQYSHKKNPRRPKGYSLQLETTQIQTGRYDQRQNQNGTSCAPLREQLQHIGREFTQKWHILAQGYEVFLLVIRRFIIIFTEIKRMS